jgi:hypothetical protein
MILEEKINYVNLPNYIPEITPRVVIEDNSISIKQNDIFLWRKNYDFDILELADSFHYQYTIESFYVFVFRLNFEKLTEKLCMCKPILHRHSFFELLKYNNRFTRFHATDEVVRDLKEFLEELPAKNTKNITEWVIETEKKLPLFCSRPTPNCIETEHFIFNLADKIIYNKSIHKNKTSDSGLYYQKYIDGGIIMSEPGINVIPEFIEGTLRETSIEFRKREELDLLKLNSNATCIITPYHKVDYWVNYLNNIRTIRLKVIRLKTRQDWMKVKYQDLTTASYVIVNKDLLEDKGPVYGHLLKWSGHNSYFTGASDIDIAFRIFLEEFLCYKNSHTSSKPIIQALFWNRIVFDEYNTHEYYKLNWVYRNLNSNKRWFISSSSTISNSFISSSILEKFFSSNCGFDYTFLFKRALSQVVLKISANATVPVEFIDIPPVLEDYHRSYLSSHRSSIFKPRTPISSNISVVNSQRELKSLLRTENIAVESFIEQVNVENNFCFLCQDARDDIVWFSCAHVACEGCIHGWSNQMITDGFIRSVKNIFCPFCKQRNINMYTLANDSIELYNKPKAILNLLPTLFGKTIVVCVEERIARQLKNYTPNAFVMDGSSYKKNTMLNNWINIDDGVLYVTNIEDICGLDDFELDHVVFYDGIIDCYNTYFKNLFKAKHYILK